MKKRFIVFGIVSVFLVTFFTGFALATNDNLQSPYSKDDQWNYSQEIIINASAGKALTDYPISVHLNSSNFNFSKAEIDGSDIRFYSENKTLNYWIETWDLKNQEATIWIKVPSLPAKGKSEILMKYGNFGVTSASNGKKTFDFFENFDGNTLSSLDWNAKGTGGGTVKVENGICEVIAPIIHAQDSSIIYSRSDFDINCMFVIKRMKVIKGADNRGPILQQGFIDKIDNRGNEIKFETSSANESHVSWETIYRGQKHNLYDLTDVSVPEGKWYISGIAWFEENNTRKIAWFKDGIRDLKMDFASNDFITNSPMHVYLYAASNLDSSNNTGYMAVDYVLVRKFVGTDPTVNVVPAQGLNSTIGKNASTENISGKTPENGKTSENNTSKNISEPAVTPKNQSENKIGTSDTEFPKYDVNLSGIELSSPYRFDSTTLVKELDSSSMNTIFLNVDIKDVWQCERFVKMAHKEGLSVHAVLLEDYNCSEKETFNACQDSLDAVLDYNRKSIAPFDGINIFINPANKEGAEDTFNYSTLLEDIRQKAGENISLSASIPSYYPAPKIEKIAPLIDFFVVRAYCRDNEELNSASSIIDAVAPQMGEIRGEGSKGLIEVSADKGFKDKVSIQKLFAELADYYSNDPAFVGVSIYDYDTYTCLPVKAVPKKTEPLIPGLSGLPELPKLPSLPGPSALSVLIGFLGAFAVLKVKGK
jgi:hypothetical protein